MYNAHCVANFVRSLAVKEFRESINISRCYRHDKGVLFFDSGCIYFIIYLLKIVHGVQKYRVMQI